VVPSVLLQTHHPVMHPGRRVARSYSFTKSEHRLVVVGKDTLDQVLSRLSTVEKGIGRPLHPTVYSAAEFKSKLASGNQFLTSVLKGQKVFLVGDEDELRKVGGVRLAKAGTDYPRRNQGLLGIVECSLAGSKVKSVLPSSQSHNR